MSAFSFSGQPFDTAALARELAHPAAGGFASFEGWVRNHNDGREVLRLEYEAFAELAVKEGERILAEARERFPIVAAACVHRLGALEIGELAVWVGVSAHHRDEAFRACRYIIDEVKQRVPIWKKEHYADGDSGWVNCERCAHPASAHEHQHEHAHAPELAQVDYSRQVALPEIGEAGQRKLAASRVLVIGAGGLGVPVCSYLAGAGVGTLTIVDGDRLEASNLHRQPLYALADVGKPKAQLAAGRLRALNPQVRVHARVEKFGAANAAQLLAQHDLAIDCTDNFAAKFLLNDACVLAARPAIFASVYQLEGQLQVYRPEDASSPCLRCIWPQATRDGITGNCAEAGVLGPVPGVLGSLQALEALKLLLGLPGQLRDAILLLDLSTLALRRLKAPRHAACTSGRCVRVSGLPAGTDPDLELRFASLANAQRSGFTLIDIREAVEAAARPLPEVTCARVGMSELLADPAQLRQDERYLLVCARGVRSREAATALRTSGVKNVYSLAGGLGSL